MTRVMSGAVIGVVAVGLLAGCAAAGREPPGLTASPSVAVESPTPSPTVEGPIDRSDPDLGIVFTDLPDVTGDARSALDMLTLFEVEFWRAQSSGNYDSGIGLIAAPDVTSVVKAQVDGNNAGGWSLSGVLTIRAAVDQATEVSATASVCRDFSEVLFSNAGVTQSASEVGIVAGDLVEVSMSRDGADGGWTVGSYAVAGTC